MHRQISVDSGRTQAIDVVRSLAMVLMAWDHTRDFLGDYTIDALDVDHTYPALFLARWITHFCAPTFVFLAGASVFLAENRPAQQPSLPWWLVARGIWLVIFEQTLLRCFGWYFHFDYRYMNAGVLWGIGWSMACLGLLRAARIPRVVLAFLATFIILFHPLVSRAFVNEWWWTVLWRSDELNPLGPHHFYVSYPVAPWLGVMLLGYSLAPVIFAKGRPAGSWKIGLFFLVAFVLVRSIELAATAWPEDWTRKTFLVLNLDKYPPSLTFVLLTVGTLLLVLRFAEFWPNVVNAPLVVFGRVPFFFYALHIPLIHLVAVMVAYALFGHAEWLYQGPIVLWDTHQPGHPPAYGFSLLWVAVAWLAILLALFPLCRWFGHWKKRLAPWWRHFV